MRLAGVRVAESVGKAAARRNVTLGVVKHLWRSPVPFVGFYPPEGVKVTEHRRYSPGAPRRVDDSDYLAGVEAHKRSFAKDLEDGMVPAGHLPGYFEVPTDEGWRIDLDLVEGSLRVLHRQRLRQGRGRPPRRPALRRQARGRRAPLAPQRRVEIPASAGPRQDPFQEQFSKK